MLPGTLKQSKRTCAIDSPRVPPEDGTTPFLTLLLQTILSYFWVAVLLSTFSAVTGYYDVSTDLLELPPSLLKKWFSLFYSNKSILSSDKLIVVSTFIS